MNKYTETRDRHVMALNTIDDLEVDLHIGDTGSTRTPKIARIKDETDMTKEEFWERWDEGEPVKIISPPPMIAGTEWTGMTDTQRQIVNACQEIQTMLLEKNRKYGNSALDPQRIFSHASPEEQIRVRIDDKLSRLKSSQTDETENTVDDLIGYLILLKLEDA